MKYKKILPRLKILLNKVFINCMSFKLLIRIPSFCLVGCLKRLSHKLKISVKFLSYKSVHFMVIWHKMKIKRIRCKI